MFFKSKKVQGTWGRNMEVPYKIKAFGWRFFVNRLLTKDLLRNRGINFSLSNSKCTFCDYYLEDRNHSFFLSVMRLRLFGGR